MSHRSADEMLRRVKVKKELTSYEKAEKSDMPREEANQCAERSRNARGGRSLLPS